MGCYCKLDEDQLLYYRHFVPLALEAFGDLSWPTAESRLAVAWAASGVPFDWEDVRWAIRSRWGTLDRDLAAVPSDQQIVDWTGRYRDTLAARAQRNSEVVPVALAAHSLHPQASLIPARRAF